MNESIRDFFEIGLFDNVEAQLLSTVDRVHSQPSFSESLALAMASRATRAGHSCVELAAASDLGQSLVALESESDHSDFFRLRWPDPAEWKSALEASSIVATADHAATEPLRPLVLDLDRIYLQRYWTHEMVVAAEMARLVATRPADDVKTAANFVAILDELFGHDSHDSRQRQAVESALQGGLTIITGGPGTGKTYTIARLLTAVGMVAGLDGHDSHEPEIALAAPTGKAAARINESIGVAFDSNLSAGTVHSLLGWLPGDGFRHNRHNPLPHDLVVVDEASMVSLSLMARLIESIRPGASLVLVGDPDQLASVEVGTVLSDIVEGSQVGQSDEGESGLSDRIVRLDSSHRFGSKSDIASLADSVRSGDSDRALNVMSDSAQIDWVDPADVSATTALVDQVIDGASRSAAAALAGNAEAALELATEIKVLAATRSQKWGLYHWSDLIEAAVASQLPSIDLSREWFIGRPVMVTANDRINRVANGDTGVVVNHDGSAMVALSDPQRVRYLSPSRLAEAESWWAMTIHKSQGSEFSHVVVSLPPPNTPILSRELLYTAITRASDRVTLLGDEESFRQAIETPIRRASGLKHRLSRVFSRASSGPPISTPR